jgi:hypothetical protein
MEFTSAQISTLEKIQSHGFHLVAWPMYGNYVGVRKGNCAALLAPLESGGFRLFGEPAYLVDGNLAVRVTREGSDAFVFKKHTLPATPERIAGLRSFAAELAELLLPVG